MCRPDPIVVANGSSTLDQGFKERGGEFRPANELDHSHKSTLLLQLGGRGPKPFGTRCC